MTKQNYGITELTFAETDAVDGGGPAVIAAAIVIGLVLLAVGYVGEHNRDNDEKKSD